MASNQDHEDIIFFLRLLKTVLESDVEVWSEVSGVAFVNGEVGGYVHEKGDRPKIQLLLARGSWRSFEQGPSSIVDILTDPVENAVVLAHEFGHHQSASDGHRTVAYEAALAKFNENRNLETAEKQLILDEELRAWTYGKKVLLSLGFKHSEQLDAIEQSAILEYQCRLGTLAIDH